MRSDEACYTVKALVVLNTLGAIVETVQHWMDLGWVAYYIELWNGSNTISSCKGNTKHVI